MTTYEQESNAPVVWTAIGLTAAAAIGIIFWLWWRSAHAGDLQALQDACKGGEQAACTELCSRVPPDVDACVKLGRDYSEGKNPDFIRAARYFDKACTAGSPEGCARIGRAQYNGKGVPRNVDAAAKSFETACGKGNQLGCAGLGHLLIFGRGGKGHDPKRGIQRAEGACKADEQRGCALLGLAYLNGLGVKRDAEKAREYFEASCKKGEERGCLGKAILLYQGQGGVERDAKKAFGIFEKACNGDLTDACAYVGMSYLTGVGAEQNTARGVRALEHACEDAPPAGCALLGELYSGGGSERTWSAIARRSAAVTRFRTRARVMCGVKRPSSNGNSSASSTAAFARSCSPRRPSRSPSTPSQTTEVRAGAPKVPTRPSRSSTSTGGRCRRSAALSRGVSRSATSPMNLSVTCRFSRSTSRAPSRTRDGSARWIAPASRCQAAGASRATKSLIGV